MTQRLARYETAIEILGMMVAVSSELIHLEREKALPDESAIQQWENEQDAFHDKDDALMLEDDDKIAQIIDVYGPVVKAAFKKVS